MHVYIYRYKCTFIFTQKYKIRIAGSTFSSISYPVSQTNKRTKGNDEIQ